MNKENFMKPIILETFKEIFSYGILASGIILSMIYSFIVVVKGDPTTLFSNWLVITLANLIILTITSAYCFEYNLRRNIIEYMETNKK